MNRISRITAMIYVVAVLLFLFAPLSMVVLFSFDSRGKGTFPIEHLTIDWYREFLGDPVMIDAAKNSLYIALASSGITLTIGVLASVALTRYRSRFVPPITTLIVLPLVLPPLLLGVALLSFFDRIGITLSLGTVIIGHSLITLPFVVLTLNAKLSGFDRSLEEAAWTLGASKFQTFRHITFPLIRSAVIGSGLLVLAISLDEFIVTFFTIGGQNTLPTLIWGQMRAGVSPVVNAISTLMLVATSVVILVSLKVFKLHVV